MKIRFTCTALVHWRGFFEEPDECLHEQDEEIEDDNWKEHQELKMGISTLCEKCGHELSTEWDGYDIIEPPKE